MNEPYCQIEEYVDCAGKLRKIRVREVIRPVGPVLEACEVIDGEPIGMMLTEQFEEGEVPPFYELRRRIRERLAARDLVRHPKTGQLELLTAKIRGQFDMPRDEGPVIWVDGKRYGWDEIGALLESYEGWGIRIEICDAGRE